MTFTQPLEGPKLRLFLLASLLGSSAALAQTVHVYSTQSIQTAIGSAANGTEIIVHPGTYSEAIDFLGKAVHLHSANGSEVTIIDATGLGRSVVTFAGTEGPSTILEGFTMTGGTGTLFRGALVGGGMYCNSDATVIDCVFSGNTAFYGGGIYCGPTPQFVTMPTLTGCVFIGNSATGEGGGLFIGDSDPKIDDCVIAGNVANQKGGGLMFGNDNFTTMIHCLINGNTAVQEGGGMYCRFSFNMQLTNCTFSYNQAVGDGGGIYKGYDTYLTLANCILWGNSDRNGGGELAQILQNGTGTLAIDYSCVQAWTGNLGGSGNTGGDPSFRDADGPDNVVGTADDDLRLTWNSVAIDAGDNTALPARVTTDLDGSPRFVDDPYVPDTGVGTAPLVDMGAYELQQIAGTHPLEVNTFSFSAAAGGTVNFSIAVGSTAAGRSYFVFVGGSGTSPGTLLPDGRTILPLNVDVFTTALLAAANGSMFPNFFGSLDANGAATAAMNLPPIPGINGLGFSFAFALFDLWNYASNPVTIVVGPDSVGRSARRHVQLRRNRPLAGLRHSTLNPTKPGQAFLGDRQHALPVNCPLASHSIAARMAP